MTTTNTPPHDLRGLSKEKKEIRITVTDKIKYIGLTHNLGRAEFCFCPIFKRGVMKELRIYRSQQEAKDNVFVLYPEIPVKTFNIEAWTHKTESPNIWQNFWCKEHKCVAFEVYVPPKTDAIEFSYHFGDNLSIRFVKL